MDTTEIYAELDAARNEMQALERVNSYSLDTAEKKLAWDVAYEKAKARLWRAMNARSDLVQRMVANG